MGSRGSKQRGGVTKQIPFLAPCEQVRGYKTGGEQSEPTIRYPPLGGLNYAENLGTFRYICATI